MDDAGFIVGSYILTFVTMAVMSWRVLRAGKRLGDQVPDDDKYWL